MANMKKLYGVAQGMGIDTQDMTPKEVIDEINKKNFDEGYRQNANYDEILKIDEARKHYQELAESDIHKGAGYIGDKMSYNAYTAYNFGEKPDKEWKKEDIISEISKIDEGKAKLASKLPLSQLKAMFLTPTSEHHMGKNFKRTQFWAFDDENVEDISQSWLDKQLKYIEDEKVHNAKMKAEKKESEMIIKEAEKTHDERLKQYLYGFEDKAKELYLKVFGNEFPSHHDVSSSGHIYMKGKKPDSYDYYRGLENFFEKGDWRLAKDNDNSKYHLERWDGEKFVKE